MSELPSIFPLPGLISCPACNKACLEIERRDQHGKAFDVSLKSFALCTECGSIFRMQGFQCWLLTPEEILELRAHPWAARIRADQEQVIAKLWG